MTEMGAKLTEADLDDRFRIAPQTDKSILANPFAVLPEEIFRYDRPKSIVPRDQREKSTAQVGKRRYRPGPRPRPWSQRWCQPSDRRLPAPDSFAADVNAALSKQLLDILKLSVNRKYSQTAQRMMSGG
jgi:hypothetical protein